MGFKKVMFKIGIYNYHAWTDLDSIALMVMQTMLGAWNKNAAVGKHAGSEMAQKIGANNLAESVMAFNTNYADAGLFGVYAVPKPDTLDDLSYCIMHEMTSLIYRAAPDDVARAHNQLKSYLLLHMDGTSVVAEDIVVGYKFNQQASLTSFFPFILLLGHELKLLSI
jgi:processing peptidase subunit beta